MPTYTRKTSDLINEGFDFGLDDYPIFDESYRQGLNKKILDHYWNYEIGQETESMFRFSLNRKMREIMPFYNQRYKSTQIEFDPLQTVNYLDLVNNTNTLESIAAGTSENVTDTDATNTEHGTNSSEGTTTSTTTGKSRSVSSETPQVQLSGNEDYASSAADVNSETAVTGDSSNSGINDSTTTLSGNSTQNSTDNSSRTDSGTGTIEREVKGSQGVASELLMLYRASFLNIDMEIISELGTLFMQIWDNGDEFNNSSNMNWGYGYAFGIL